QHPHICALHDVGEQDGIVFLVMEHLEGETLAGRLKKGPLPLDQVLAVGIALADALARAHREGVVHRDLKPANVMLTRTGAKLLDFGLATGLDAETAPGGSPPVELAESSATALPGTLPYMAPEQLEGGAVGHAADVWALGC